MKALIVVDYQNDFVSPDASMYVKGAEHLAPLIDAISATFSHIVLTKDWHKAADPSFKEQGGPWPSHCVRGSLGSDIWPHLRCADRADMVLHKTGYSAFFDNDGSATGLHGYLRDNWIDQLMIVGVALDYCVRDTALDAARIGFVTSVGLSATKPVDSLAWDRVVKELRRAGVEAT